MGTPTFVQHISTSESQLGTAYWAAAQPGNPYHLTLPNVAGGGNCLIMGLSCPFSAGRTISITDDKSNTWTLARTVNNGSKITSVYVALNVVSGTYNITITFDTALYNCQFCITEFFNIASASALDGSSTATLASPVTSGSFTPGTAGDLIYHYGYDVTLSGTPKISAITSMTPGSGFTPLSMDIMLGTFAQYTVQAAISSISPSMTVTGGSNSFNSVAIALKSATQGTAPSRACRVLRRNEILYTRAGVSYQFPCSGSLLIISTSRRSSTINVAGCSSSPANTWVESSQSAVGGITPPQIWFAANASTSFALTITPNCQGGSSGAGAGDNGTSFYIYDVAGAGDFDATAGFATAELTTSSFNQALSNFPTITPSVANGFIFTTLQNSFGPPGSLTNPVPPIGFLDTSLYGGQIDADLMNNADGYSHYYNPDTSTVSFNYIMNSSQSASNELGIAFAFKPLAAPSIVRPQPTASSGSTMGSTTREIAREQAAPGTVSSAASTTRRVIRALMAYR